MTYQLRLVNLKNKC